MPIHPVILSGGAGTRLWPLSRALYPKQFMRHVGGVAGSLLQATALRLGRADGFAPQIVVCNSEHRFLVRDELESAGVAGAQVVLEPVGRGTAPAVAVAALLAAKSDPEAVLAVMPSDHVIRDPLRFVGAIRDAAAIARSGRLVLLGVAPSKPHPGYGYIELGVALADATSRAFGVAGFHEKPDSETAQKYLASGGYLWNSGIFVLHAATLLAELRLHAPAVADAAQRAVAGAKLDLGFLQLDRPVFSACPSISIDHAVMEKTKAAAVLPLDVGWSDVGSWAALWELAPHDASGNAVNGAGLGLLEETRNCYVHSEHRLIATLGLENIVVVDTPDALLVADRSCAENVGSLVARLKALNRLEHAGHVRQHRPWGSFEPLNIGARFQVKRLIVKPGGKLSRQMHYHRSEHWVVVRGTARVTIGEEVKLVGENESAYISATQWHRLENPGKVDLEIIEIQIGTYLGEDDIIRSDDIYQRNSVELAV